MARNTDAETITQAFYTQAAACGELGSPFMEGWSRLELFQRSNGATFRGGQERQPRTSVGAAGYGHILTVRVTTEP